MPIVARVLVNTGFMATLSDEWAVGNVISGCAPLLHSLIPLGLWSLT